MQELIAHVGRRTGVGTTLLVGTFEAAPWIKRQVRAARPRGPDLNPDPTLT